MQVLSSIEAKGGGHLCMCAGCAGAMLKAKGKEVKCPLCEHDIDEIVKIYI